MTSERLSIHDHATAAEDAAGERRWSFIEDDDVDLIGPQMRGDDADHFQFAGVEVGSVIEVHGDVNVTQRLEIACRRSTEEVGEDDVRVAFQCLAECLEPRTCLSGERVAPDHGPQYTG